MTPWPYSPPLMETLVRISWAVTIVGLLRAGMYWQAGLVVSVGGYALFRMHWAGRLAHTYHRLVRAFDAAAESNRDDPEGFLEDTAVLSVAAHEAAERHYWAARWPFVGVRFRHATLPPCSCGGAQLYVERGVRKPPYPAVCMRCGQGARNVFEQDIARAGRRWAEGQGIEV